MTRLAITLALLAAPVAAQDRHEWTLGGARSYVALQAATDPACVARVTFRDEPVHSGVEDFSLSRDGMSVRFRIRYNGGMPGETLFIEAPAGFYARPDMLEPGEHQEAEAHICPLGLAS